MYERFTERVRKVMALANQEAQRFGHEYIGTEHILLGLVEEGSGVGANVLTKLGVNLGNAKPEVDKLASHGPAKAVIGKLPHTAQAKKVIEYAIGEARDLNCHYVGTEHLLLGLLRVEGDVAAVVLTNFGLKVDTVREEVRNLLEAGGRKKLESSKVLIVQAIEALQAACCSAGAEGDQALAAQLMEQIRNLSAIVRGS